MSNIISEDEILTFGKYKARNIKDIIIENPSYCQWMLSRNDYLNDTQKSILTKSIKTDDYYLTFGKYKNKTLKSIYESDKQYIHYLKNNEYIKTKMPTLLDELSKLNH
jgi:uncharacterized protein (DUF3820 family)